MKCHDYFLKYQTITKNSNIQLYSLDQPLIKVSLLGLDQHINDTLLHETFESYGTLKHIKRHTFKFNDETFLNGNTHYISLK